MKHEIENIINKYWTFDENQHHTHTWHEKQDCLKDISKISERIKIEYTIGILHELLEEIPVGSKESKIISNKFQQLQNQLKDGK